MKKKTLCVFLLAFVITIFSATVVCAEYHHVDGCLVCHDMHEESSNLAMIWEVIETPNSDDKAVIFLNRTGSNSFADGDATYDGVCEVCHTDTTHHQNDGDNPDPDPHYAGTDCIDCHDHKNQFSHGGGAGVGCEACHGHDAGYEYQPGEFSEGAGTVKSHSTHTEDDSDDLKGPNIACDVCHDTSNYPFFKLGTGNAPYDLSETDVCDACHSPDGAFDGVLLAQANWDDGVYEVDGETLKSGKEQWCATCHDDEPAFSRPSPGIEIVVDNPDADFMCDWGTSPSGGYNGDYRWYAKGDGSCKATWTPDLPVADNYKVYAWWKTSSNRATDAKYTIYYDGGSKTIEVNQELNGNQWNLLGTFPFEAGTSGYVVLDNAANEFVIADAIKFDNGNLGTSIITAPNVIGDDSTYGFYVTGHAINCLNCHDGSKKHIDHEHRTYEVDDSTGTAVNPYAASYRLQGTNSKPAQYLCFVCHNSAEVLGQSRYDVSHTNFWNDDGDIVNSHRLHFAEQTGIQFDSDWDGAIDSAPSCIACHNVHGPPNQAMIRHGELISSYGTTDKIPALNFAYLAPSMGPFATATWTPDLAQSGSYGVYAWWNASLNRATNANYTIYYEGDHETVRVNQETNGGQWNLLGIFPFAAGASGYVVLSNEGADEYVIADAVGWDTNDDEIPDIIIDNDGPGFDSDPEDEWGYSGSGGYFDGGYFWHAKPVQEPDPKVDLVDSIAGRMSLPGPGVAQNGVCWACHSGYTYERAPYLGPKVIMGQGEPDTVPNDGDGTSLITVFVSDPDGDVSTVEIDLTPIGGSANQAMNDEGSSYYSYLVTIPADTADSPLSFTITARDDSGNTAEGTATLIVVDPDSIYVDNQDAEFVCEWGVSFGGYEDNYRWHAAGDGSCTATWTPQISQAATYNVYAWWEAAPNRATNVKYTIYYDGGSRTVVVNQELNGGQWNYLGNFLFAAGTAGHVVLSDNANQFIIADAIKLEPAEPLSPQTVIVDNGDAEFVCDWGTSPSGGYNGDYHWHAKGDGSCTATWTPNLAAEASYDVYAWWKASANRATDTKYTIYYSGGSETIEVNQELNGGQWNLLGTFHFAAGTSGYVVLSNDANEYVIADAIKLEPHP